MKARACTHAVTMASTHTHTWSLAVNKHPSFNIRLYTTFPMWNGFKVDGEAGAHTHVYKALAHTALAVTTASFG